MKPDFGYLVREPPTGGNFERPYKWGEILVVAQHELRTRRPKHRIIGVSSNSHEAKSKARCRSDIAVGIPHENDPNELLLMVKSRAGDRDTSDLFAFSPCRQAGAAR